MIITKKGYKRLYAKINLDAIRANARALTGNVRTGIKSLAVIKADAYGHGDVPVAKALVDMVTGFAVATITEAVNLRKNGIKNPILILGFVDPDDFDELVEYEIDGVLYDYEDAFALNEAAKKQGKIANCQIKVDTGMHRIGLRPVEESVSVVAEIKKLKNLNVRGIFTHFAKADETDKAAANRQFAEFTRFIEMCKKKSITFEIAHCANSAAIIDLPEFALDQVRLGIALYGMYPSEEVSKALKLKPALSLYSEIAMVKTLHKGESVGYGGTFTAENDVRVATVTVGYGDGYPRRLSNKGYVLIHGKKAKIIGRVCMDQIMVDVTEIPEARVRDSVTLVGTDGDLTVTVEELAELAGTFNYEFVCALGKRIPRVYEENGKVIGTHDYFDTCWDF